MWSRHSAAHNYDYDANLKFNFSCANVYIHNPSNGLVVIKPNNSIFLQPPLNIQLERMSNNLLALLASYLNINLNDTPSLRTVRRPLCSRNVLEKRNLGVNYLTEQVP